MRLCIEDRYVGQKQLSLVFLFQLVVGWELLVEIGDYSLELWWVLKVLQLEVFGFLIFCGSFFFGDLSSVFLWLLQDDFRNLISSEEVVSEDLWEIGKRFLRLEERVFFMQRKKVE